MTSPTTPMTSMMACGRGLFDVIDLGDDPLVGAALAQVLKAYPKLERPRMIHETVRRLISAMVNDVLAESGEAAARRSSRVGR